MKKWINKYKWAILVTISTLLLLQIISMTKNNTKDYDLVTYNEFIQHLEKGEVDTVYYSSSEELMYFTLFTEESKKMTREERKDYKYKDEQYRSVYYPAYDEFRKDMLSYDVELKLVSNTSILDILPYTGPILMIVLFVSMIRSMIPKTNIDKIDLTPISTTKFSDVIGQDEILEDVKYITMLLKNPNLGDDMGVKAPRGILFSGPPGTGKTLIAKAIAGEAGVPFIYMSGSEFVELYVGLGAKKVREVFKRAKENAPCILFIDEIDSIGGKRGSKDSHSEREQTLNALLTEMDGFNKREQVFVIAATNRAEMLDDALVRAGRFDRQVVINPPKTWNVRAELFKLFLKDKKISEDVNYENLSKQVVGFTGADIEAVCNEAGLIALLKEKNAIDTECLEEAIDKRLFHGNRSKTSYEKDKEIVAYHEAGHAVQVWLQKQPITRVSIASTTSGVGGFVMQSESESLFTTDAELRSQILICYAGRAAEAIKFKEVTTGASNDITQATKIMLNYIQKYGFDKPYGIIDIGVLAESQLVSADSITERITKMSTDFYADCEKLLQENFDKVEKVAAALLLRETLDADEIMAILEPN